MFQAFEKGNNEPGPVSRRPVLEGPPVAWKSGRAVDVTELVLHIPTPIPSYFSQPVASGPYVLRREKSQGPSIHGEYQEAFPPRAQAGLVPFCSLSQTLSSL